MAEDTRELMEIYREPVHPGGIVLLSVIVVTWNNAAIIAPCLDSVSAQGKNLPLEVLVVDNASGDGTPALLRRQFPQVRLIESGSNLGFNAGCNLGMKQARGQYYLLLNPDTEIVPGALKTMLAFMEEHPPAGILGCQLLYPDGRLQPSCRAFPTARNMFYELLGLSKIFPRSRRFGEYMMTWWDHRDQREVDQPMGAALLVRRRMVEEVGLFDEDYFMLFGEVDWCYRAKAKGWKIYYTPQAQIIHHHSTSINKVKSRMIIDSHQGFYRFYRKHHPRSFLAGAGRPLFAGMLALLAGVRIGVRFLRMQLNKIRDKS